MQAVNDCFKKVKKDCFKFISSQETKKDKFKTVTSQFPNTTKNSGNVTVKTELTKPGLAETRHLSL